MSQFKSNQRVCCLFAFLAFVFLSANMATDGHMTHSAGAKLISLDHQVRCDLSLAERKNLRTGVLSFRGEAGLDPLQAVAGIPQPPEFVVNSCATPRPLMQFGPKTLILKLSVLNI